MPPLWFNVAQVVSAISIVLAIVVGKPNAVLALVTAATIAVGGALMTIGQQGKNSRIAWISGIPYLASTVLVALGIIFN